MKTPHPNAKHGLSGTPEYRAWAAMRNRCLSPRNTNYALYGGRGIRICAEWVDSFETFLRDMGHKPTPAHSLDRVNTYGNYEPGNCRWATQRQQNQNRRPYWRIIDGRPAPWPPRTRGKNQILGLTRSPLISAGERLADIHIGLELSLEAFEALTFASEATNG